MKIQFPISYKVDEMADEKVKDQFAETVVTAAGEFPAYPQVIYQETGNKHPDGSPVMKQIGVAKNVDEHKKMLKKEPAVKDDWGK